MEKITELCTGCRACEQLCAHKAIQMLEDNEGFLTATINQEICVDCGLCQKRCPQNSQMATLEPKKVIAARNKDDEELRHSASGGAFVAIAHHVLREGGVVFGAAYNESLHVGHIKVENISELIKLQSSKYVQSNTEATYSEVKTLLKDGRKVLYSGTPCQIGGLYAYLGKEGQNENLLTIDVICHGVPSPALFEKYLDWLGGEMGGKILFYDFRTKVSGWGLGYKSKTKTKTKTKTGVLDPYYYHFLKGHTYRESCYRCQYSQKNRVADFTIGDYWGIEKEHREFYSTKGVSVVLLNTEKALAMRPLLDNLFYTIDSTFEKAVKENHNLNHPTERKAIRDHIYDGMNTMSLDEYFGNKLVAPRPLVTVIKSVLPIGLKLWLKRLKY